MRIQAAPVLAMAAQAAAHGYVYQVTADNVVYPGWDVMLDPYIEPTPARIAYGGGYVFPILDLASRDVACNRNAKPVPAAIAEVRAGSHVTFHWSQWLHTHKGPITAWMAPYDDGADLGSLSVNELEFFKIAEDAIDENGVWGTMKMVDETNNTWTTTIPADLKPGNYVMRHEIIALHFALGTKAGFQFVPVGPQFYMTCFNVRVTEGGDAVPRATARFPGAYHRDDAGLHFNVTDVGPGSVYPSLGPPMHEPEYYVNLDPRPPTVVSPTGGQGEAADAAYFAAQSQALQKLGALIAAIVARGG